jgi:hypothetical protein
MKFQEFLQGTAFGEGAIPFLSIAKTGFSKSRFKFFFEGGIPTSMCKTPRPSELFNKK